MSPVHFDTAIVGGGLAGTCMAFTLLQNGKTVLLIDDESLSASSRVAAGIYNPVVFKRTTLAWRAAELLDSSLAFYSRVESLTAARFHYRVPFYRFFSGYEEQNEWMARSGQEAFMPFLSDQMPPTPPLFTAPYGLSTVQVAGWVDTKTYIGALRAQLPLRGGHLLSRAFDAEALQRTAEGFAYEGFSFDKIVFCEGHLVARNRWFGFIPLFPVKGEVLELETAALPANHIYNGAAYLLVMHNGRVKLGSTYDWQNLNDEPTEAGRAELIEKLEGFYLGEKKVVAHAAGVRPAARDRRPVLGEHPHEKNMYVLNGLGAKGVTQGPWCAAHLYACMYGGTTPPADVWVQRFVK